MSLAAPMSFVTRPSLTPSSATGLQASEATVRSYGGGSNGPHFKCDAPISSYGAPTHDGLANSACLVVRQESDFGSTAIPSIDWDNGQHNQDYRKGAGYMAAKAVRKYGETMPEQAEVIKSAIHAAAKDWTWDNAAQAIDAIGSMSATGGHPFWGPEQQREAGVLTGPLLNDYHRPGQQPYWAALETSIKSCSGSLRGLESNTPGEVSHLSPPPTTDPVVRDSGASQYGPSLLAATVAGTIAAVGALPNLL